MQLPGFPFGCYTNPINTHSEDTPTYAPKAVGPIAEHQVQM
jgi:hypothetical protein